MTDNTSNQVEIQDILDNLHDNYRMYFCFSDEFSDLFKIFNAYKEVKLTSFFVTSLNEINKYYTYDDYKLYEVICNIPPVIRNKFICSAYFKINDYDKTNSTDYIKTIYNYVLNEKDILKTSEMLFIHKNTLYYRFKRINELFSINCDNNKELFKLYYTFIIINLNSIELDYNKII